jgi:CheY-like chemotaxis protein
MTDSVGRILLVDDNAMDIELTLEAFGVMGLDVDVTVARTGCAALAALSGDRIAVEPESLPDLVLLDLKMPGIDGLEVLRAMKATPGIRRIPVILLTSSSEEGDVVTAYELGANSYLVKPVGFGGFLDVVRRIHEYWILLNVHAPTGLNAKRAVRSVRRSGSVS